MKRELRLKKAGTNYWLCANYRGNYTIAAWKASNGNYSATIADQRTERELTREDVASTLSSVEDWAVGVILHNPRLLPRRSN